MIQSKAFLNTETGKLVKLDDATVQIVDVFETADGTLFKTPEEVNEHERQTLARQQLWALFEATEAYFDEPFIKTLIEDLVDSDLGPQLLSILHNYLKD